MPSVSRPSQRALFGCLVPKVIAYSVLCSATYARSKYANQTAHQCCCLVKGHFCNFQLITNNLFMSSVPKFGTLILGWCHEILGWKFIMICNWEEKTCFGPIRKFVYLIFITNFRNIIPKLTSQNIVPKTWKKIFCPDLLKPFCCKIPRYVETRYLPKFQILPHSIQQIIYDGSSKLINTILSTKTCRPGVGSHFYEINPEP